MPSLGDSDWESVSDNAHWEDARQSSSEKVPVPSGASTSNLTPLKYVCLLDEKIDENFTKIKEAWPSIKNQIFNILEKSSATAGYMTAISLFKLGTSTQRHSNPKTVYVSVSAGSSEERWPPVLEKMQGYLDTFGFDLHVHLEHNEMCHELFELLPAPQDASSSPTENEEDEEWKIDSYFEKSERDHSDGGHFRLLPEANLKRYEKLRRDQDFAPNIHEEYKIKVCPGADIGAAKYITPEDGHRVSPLTGSLACWLDITLRNGKTKTVGLTTYHVLRPAIRGYRLDSEERKYRPPGPGWNSASLVSRSATTLADPDKYGECDLDEIDHNAYVEPRDRYKRYPPVKIEHPTRAKHNAIVETSNASIANPLCTFYWKRKTEEGLRKHTAFFDDGENVLGSVILASGILNCTSTKGRLDVGLILPDDPARIGPNKVPVWDSFNKKYNVDILPHYSSVPDPMMRDSSFIPEADGPGKIYTPLPSLPHLSYVYKCGPSFAGSSIGQTSAFPSDIAFTEDDHSHRGWIEPGTSIRSRRSTEFVVAINSTFYDKDSRDKYPFAYAGDNGTLVWDKHGRILGMLIASQIPKGTETGLYVVTTIEAVFEGIKKVSQGRILDVKLRTETAPAQDQGRYNSKELFLYTDSV